MSKSHLTGAILGGLVIATGGAVAGFEHFSRQSGPVDVVSARAVRESVTDPGSNVVGYDVTYRDAGREHTVRMKYDPGRKILLLNGEPVVK